MIRKYYNLNLETIYAKSSNSDVKVWKYLCEKFIKHST